MPCYVVMSLAARSIFLPALLLAAASAGQAQRSQP